MATRSLIYHQATDEARSNKTCRNYELLSSRPYSHEEKQIGLLSLMPVDTHMLPKVVVATERFVATRERTQKRWIQGINHCPSRSGKGEIRFSSRFSFVWMLRTCRLRCSPLAKHFPQSFTSQMKERLALWVAYGLMEFEVVGTLLPRLFFVKLGTGTGPACPRRRFIGGGTVMIKGALVS